jgi:nucleotide-binding universal stress UspA family protein
MRAAAGGHAVVVGVDGTEDGQRALRYALGEARRKGQAVRLVHAWSDPAVMAPRMPYAPDPALRERGAEILFAAEREATAWGLRPGQVTSTLVNGPRVAALMDNLRDASCLVMGPRPPARTRHGGSTTNAVATRSPVPVHCVPEAWDPAQPESHRGVVGVDGSDATADVVSAAFVEARSRAARLEVVHAWWPTDDYDAVVGGGPLAREWEDVARAALTRTVEQVAGPAPDVRWEVRLHFERPVPALTVAAAGADLLVLGRRARHGPLRPGLGSTARTLLRAVPCPVLVLPVLRRAVHDGDWATTAVTA